MISRNFSTVDDLIVGYEEATEAHPKLQVTEALSTIPVARLRVDVLTGDVLDVKDNTVWYQDECGRLHITPINPAWEEVHCAWDATFKLLNGAYVLVTEELTAELEAQQSLDALKQEGEMYGAYRIPFSKRDGDAVLQVKIAFDLGAESSVLHFSNGVKFPVSAENFSAFARWFFTKRVQLFK